MSLCKVQQIDSGWAYKPRDKTITNVLEELESTSGWKEAKQFPSEIHAELIAAGTITHPYKVESDTDLRWVNDAEWLYSTTFPYEFASEKASVDIHFDGLDTYCTVYLNGAEILQADNMLLPYTVPLTLHLPLHLKTTNNLLLHFKSAKAIAKELERKYGPLRAGSCNLGDPSRVYARKAQYQWGWDWGPEVMSVGPWRPVYLKTWDVLISGLEVSANVDCDLNRSLEGRVTLSHIYPHAHSMTVVLSSHDGKHIVREERYDLSKHEPHALSVSWAFQRGEIELWWPIHYGSQPLYKLEVIVFAEDGNALDQKAQVVGFRNVQLIQEKLVDTEGTTFLFEINNQRVFMGGE
ncbi:hypothetical protein FRB97_009614 [Tulasnella sp. 331]|nr:hypothetical protein FRB97_009614 [Tulasnella sp. 331]